MNAVGGRSLGRRRFVVAVRVTGRIVQWQFSVVALGLLAFVMWQTNGAPDTDRRLVTLCTSMALAPILVDPAGVTLASSPTPVRRRFAHRFVWVVPAIVLWLATQWIFIADPHRLSPPRWSWIELTTSLAVVLAAELTAARRARATGLTGVAALLCFGALLAAASRYVDLLPTDEHELRFVAMAAVAIVWCRVVSRDPAVHIFPRGLNRPKGSSRQTEKQQSISEGTCNDAQVRSSR